MRAKRSTSRTLTSRTKTEGSKAIKCKAVLWFCVAVALAAIISLYAAAEGEGPQSPVQKLPEQRFHDAVRKVQECLQALNNSKDLSHYDEALPLLVSVLDGDTSGGWWKRRRRAWFVLTLRFVDFMDRNIDTTYDPEEFVYSDVAPPPETGMPSGVDPKEIEDPKLREEYETALRLYREGVKRCSFQSGLRKAREQLLCLLNLSVECGYGAGAEEAQQVEQALKKCLSKESTRNEIRALIAA